IVLGSAIASVVIIAAFFVFRTKTVVDVAMGEVTSGTIVRRIFATGTLQATRTVDVGTQVSGIVSSLGADFNSIVHKEQIIARLDPSLYQAALNQTKASLDQSQAALQHTNAHQGGATTEKEAGGKKRPRAGRLAKNKLIRRPVRGGAKPAMNDATAAVASARAQVQDAAAVVEQARAAVK